MMIADIDHVALRWSALDEGIAVLRDVFGMQVLRRGTHARTGEPIVFMADGASRFQVEIIGTSDRTPDSSGAPGPTFEHVAFRVENVDAAYQALTAAGWTSIAPPHELLAARATTALLRGPGGLDVQIVHYETGGTDS